MPVPTDLLQAEGVTPQHKINVLPKPPHLVFISCVSGCAGPQPLCSWQPSNACGQPRCCLPPSPLFSTQVCALQAELEAARHQLAVAQDEEERLGQDIEELTGELHRTRVQATALRADNEVVQGELAGTRQQLAVAQDEEERLGEDIDQLTEELHAVKAGVAALQDANASLAAENEVLEAEAGTARKGLAAAMKEAVAQRAAAAGVENAEACEGPLTSHAIHRMP
jgi:regulator of replication initiation timing